MSLWPNITAMGDLAVLVPSVGLMLVWLSLFPATRAVAWRWAILFLFVAGLVAASKLTFMAWGWGIRRLNFIGVSGHSAMAALVWPSMLGLVFDVQWRRWRLAAMVSGQLLALFIAISRLMLHAHSMAEVVAGFVVGSTVALLFLTRFGDRWRLQGRGIFLAASVLLMLPFVYGHRFPSERILRVLAQHLSVDNTVYTRRYFHDYYD